MCFLQFLLSVISIHVLREEDDPSRINPHTDSSNFNPRPPRGGRRSRYYINHNQWLISIHVLREEDDVGVPEDTTPAGISIHVLREEDDSLANVKRLQDRLFQSTSSARRTTV